VPSTTSTSEKTPKIKREDIGTFDPHWPDPEDTGVVANGKNLIFTDVNSFVGGIETFLETPIRPTPVGSRSFPVPDSSFWSGCHLVERRDHLERTPRL